MEFADGGDLYQKIVENKKEEEKFLGKLDMECPYTNFKRS